MKLHDERSWYVPVTVDPAVTGHLEVTGEVPALQAMSLEVTSCTGELDVGWRAHWVSCLWWRSATDESSKRPFCLQHT